MNYDFPHISCIEDVLPHIEGYDEIIVSEKEDYTVVNYIVVKPNTFDIDSENPLPGQIRRECRGLIFDTASGKILSRPFHKFFNIGEREETQLSVLDFSKDHTIPEKMDGSMIRPFFTQGTMRLGTRMGITDVSMQAEEWLAEQSPETFNHMYALVECGFTPLYEWVSPENNIVVKYDEPLLVCLGLRNTEVGTYIKYPKNRYMDVVTRSGRVGADPAEYVSQTRSKEGCEGVIVQWSDGHMVKLKNDWYVRIHKVKDRIRTDRHIIALSIEGEIDDIKPNLDKADFDKVKETEAEFWNTFNKKVTFAEDFCQRIIKRYNNDRKHIAIDYVPFLKGDRHWPGLIFGVMDGKSVHDMILSKVVGSLGTGKKFDAVLEWLRNDEILQKTS